MRSRLSGQKRVFQFLPGTVRPDSLGMRLVNRRPRFLRLLPPPLRDGLRGRWMGFGVPADGSCKSGGGEVWSSVVSGGSWPSTSDDASEVDSSVTTLSSSPVHPNNLVHLVIKELT